MKKIITLISVIFCVSSFLLVTTACSLGSEVDSAVGTYYIVYEYGPTYTRENLDYKMILNGKGGGEYHKEGNVHKIKYKYEEPEIVITDNTTGITYKGTLSEGKLLVYDGKIGDDMTSEFLFQSQYAK